MPNNAPQYARDEPVSLWQYSLGPYHNPHEQCVASPSARSPPLFVSAALTQQRSRRPAARPRPARYHYYSLPFCRPAAKLEPATRFGGLADMFGELENSNLDVRFAVDIPRSTICSMALDAAGAQLLAYAVSNHYWYEMYLDELPVWAMGAFSWAAAAPVGAVSPARHPNPCARSTSLPLPLPVGEVVADEDVIREIESHTERPHGIADATYLYTHKNITVLYNGDQIIEVHLASEDAAPIGAGKSAAMESGVRADATRHSDRPLNPRAPPPLPPPPVRLRPLVQRQVDPDDA